MERSTDRGAGKYINVYSCVVQFLLGGPYRCIVQANTNRIVERPLPQLIVPTVRDSGGAFGCNLVSVDAWGAWGARDAWEWAVVVCGQGRAATVQASQSAHHSFATIHTCCAFNRVVLDMWVVGFCAYPRASKPSTGFGRATVGSGKLPSCASVTSLPKAGISPLFQSLRCQPHLVCVCVLGTSCGVQMGLRPLTSRRERCAWKYVGCEAAWSCCHLSSHSMLVLA